MIIEVHGIELFGRHGVNDDERRDGQTFLVDVSLHADEPRDDAIAATLDYRSVRDVVRAVNEADSFHLLETFAAAIADSLRDQLRPERVEVRVRKPGVAWAEWTAVSVMRP